MNTGDNQTNHPLQAICMVLASGLALAIAMGVGRFALTPLLPFMLSEQLIRPDSSNLFAIANYLGYLLGAVSVTRLAIKNQQQILLGLAGVSLSTLAMALVDHDLIAAGTLLRGLAGIFSAWTLVSTSSWAMQALSSIQRPHWSGYVYCGVGGGIALAGGLVWWLRDTHTNRIWLILGLLCLICSALVWQLSRHVRLPAVQLPARPIPIHQTNPSNQSHQSNHPTEPGLLQTRPSRQNRQQTGLLICYGLFGYSYVLPATYLPAMARSYMPDPASFGLIWPVFGFAALVSVIFATRWLGHMARRRVWAAAQLLLAIGVILPVWRQTAAVLALAALLSGATFMVITMAGLQLARQLQPDRALVLQGKMTAAFALGQIAGPLSVALNDYLSANHTATPLGLLILAAALLGLSSCWLLAAPHNQQTD